jgi:hypothetical protein
LSKKTFRATKSVSAGDRPAEPGERQHCAKCHGAADEIAASTGMDMQSFPCGARRSSPALSAPPFGNQPLRHFRIRLM